VRLVSRVIGNLLIGVCVLGLIALGAVTLLPPSPSPSLTTAIQEVALPAPVQALAARLRTVIDGAPALRADPAVAPDLGAAPELPITRVVVASIGLDTEVADAALVAVNGGYTWQVPAFKAGHAQSTAGAGQNGNAVLLGHVTSVHSGNVFANLDRVQIGDTVQVFSGDEQFIYTVDSTRAVPRTDSTVLDPTPTPTVSLITCTGLWLPAIWDYTERLVVRAELSA
jgi:sortase A